jgi:hypothetical protein
MSVYPAEASAAEVEAAIVGGNPELHEMLRGYNKDTKKSNGGGKLCGLCASGSLLPTKVCQESLRRSHPLKHSFHLRLKYKAKAQEISLGTCSGSAQVEKQADSGIVYLGQRVRINDSRP